jgi:RNA polymerase sigma-70 factor (ECF subfamily)
METTLATLARPASAIEEAVTRGSFDAVIRQHQRRVYRVVFLLVRDSDAADTLTQECFLKAYQKLDTFRGEARFDTWLLKIAVNLARDHIKNRRASFWKRLIGLDDPEPSAVVTSALASPQPSAERVLLAREQLDAVWNRLDALSEQQRSIFLLRFAEDLSLAEIAQLLGLKVGSVKAQLFRATSTIRQRVKENYDVATSE